jgi:centromeric protein E
MTLLLISTFLYIQDDYRQLEMHAADMKAEICSLQEALNTSIAEKDETLSKVELLTFELEEYVNKLSSAESERDSLSEKITVLVQNSYFSKYPLSDMYIFLHSVFYSIFSP